MILRLDPSIRSENDQRLPNNILINLDRSNRQILFLAGLGVKHWMDSYTTHTTQHGSKDNTDCMILLRSPTFLVLTNLPVIHPKGELPAHQRRIIPPNNSLPDDAYMGDKKGSLTRCRDVRHPPLSAAAAHGNADPNTPSE